MSTTRLVAVGAIACDILLGVPFFPTEDSKLRATSFTRRRGGNVGNMFEVLQQLLGAGSREGTVGDGQEAASKVKLTLVAALPARTSPSIDFIALSFAAGSAPVGAAYQQSALTSERSPIEVDLRHCLYRDGHHEPITSYIISNEASLSRTIVNHNALPEMTFEEFAGITDRLLQVPSSGAHTKDDHFWFHFEGRIPETTRQCMWYLRRHAAFRPSNDENSGGLRLSISVELEKPRREGLQDLARLADVVFYSRSWAEGEGYESAEDCLRSQAIILREPSVLDHHAHASPQQKLLICTWGSGGACGMHLEANLSWNQAENPAAIVHSPAHKSEDAPVVDTTGAGDTFIAGILYQLLRKDVSGFASAPTINENSILSETLDFANALAGRKVVQHGFQGLA